MTVVLALRRYANCLVQIQRRKANGTYILLLLLLFLLLMLLLLLLWWCWWRFAVQNVHV